MIQLSKKEKFIIAVALQFLMILAMLFFKLAIATGGEEVLLRIAPVDPRDPLRGDYVTFRYDISEIDRYRFAETPRNGQTVYVELEKTGKYWGVKEVFAGKPENGLYLKAIVKSGGSDTAYGEGPYAWGSAPLRVDYGMEQYFIKEGAGAGFSFAGKENSAKVAVDKNGNGVIKQVYVDDRPWP